MRGAMGLACWTAAAWVACAGCGCSCNGSSTAGDAWRDGGVGDSGPEASIRDAAREASARDAGPGSDCTISVLPSEEVVPGELYRLPPTGENEIGSVDWNGWHVAYSEHRCPFLDPRGDDIYVFDLQTMQETATRKMPERPRPAKTSKPPERSRPAVTSRPPERPRPPVTSKPPVSSKPPERSKSPEKPKRTETSRPPERPKTGEKSKPPKKSGRRKKARKERTHLFVASGCVVPPLPLDMTLIGVFPYFRLGVRWKWLDFVVQVSYFTEDDGQFRYYYIIAAAGFWAYSLRLSWLRLRHGIHVGMWYSVVAQTFMAYSRQLGPQRRS